MRSVSRLLVVVVAVLVCLGAKRQGTTESGLRFVADDAIKARVDGFGAAEKAELERVYGESLSVIALEVTNKSKDAFEWHSFYPTKACYRGAKVFTPADVNSALWRSELEGKTRDLFRGGTVAAGGSRTFLVAFPGDMDWTQVVRLELYKFGGQLIQELR